MIWSKAKYIQQDKTLQLLAQSRDLLISDCYNSRLTTIRIPENKESKKMVKPPSKSNGRRELDGDRPASEEVVQVDTVREEFRDSSNEGWDG